MAKAYALAHPMSRPMARPVTDELSTTPQYSPVFTGDSRLVATGYDTDKTKHTRISAYLIPSVANVTGYGASTGFSNQSAVNDGLGIGAGFGSGTAYAWGGSALFGSIPQDQSTFVQVTSDPDLVEKFCSANGTPNRSPVGANADAVKPVYLGASVSSATTPAVFQGWTGRIEHVKIEERVGGKWQLVRHWPLTNADPETGAFPELVAGDHATVDVAGSLSYEESQNLSYATPPPIRKLVDITDSADPFLQGGVAYDGNPLTNADGTFLGNTPGSLSLRFGQAHFIPFHTQTEGCFYFELTLFSKDMTAWTPTLVPIISGGDYNGDGFMNDRVLLAYDRVNDTFQTSNRTGGTLLNFGTALRSGAASDRMRIAVAWDATNVRCSIDGITSTIANANPWPWFSELWIGGGHLAGSGGLDGAVFAGFAQYDNLSNQELAVLTTYGNGNF